MHGSHSHGHPHGHAHGTSSRGIDRAGHRRRLGWALALTLTFMVVEAVTAYLAGSLALLADAGHMLTDAGGLALAFIASHLGERPATPQKTFGYLRAEILSALVNAVVLLLLAVYILYEAWQRFVTPHEVAGVPMLVVACVGLGVNLISMRLLVGAADESLNLRGAYLEVLSDMLGSLGVVVAALVIMATGWTLIDPLVGAGIGLFIIPRTWRLLMQAVHILLEGAPAQVDLGMLRTSLAAIPGVRSVCDLHVWTIASGVDAMSGHLVVDDMGDAARVLMAARAILKDEFGIGHVTVQIETEAMRADEPHLPI